MTTSAAAPPERTLLQRVDHLDLLESHAIFIIREVAAECERPVLLFSGGKDSAVLLHLAVKAFAPALMPFPVMHIDTGHNFTEVIEYRDTRSAAAGAQLVVASVQASIDAGRVMDPGEGASRNRIQSTTLLDAINEHKFDAAFGGARRDEDKARAKERVLSFRDSVRQVGPAAPAPRLGSSTRAGEPRRAPPRLPAVGLDPARHLAVHRA